MQSHNGGLPEDISVQETRALLSANGECLLLDCRNQNEYELVHLDGATLIPMGEISRRVHELKPYVERRVIVYCHHGGRSQMVADWLRQQGFSCVQNMAGGIDAWSCLIDTNLPRY